MTVTRINIADAVEDAFTQRQASKADLLDWANTHGAGETVIAALSRLPERNFRTLRDLWPHLPGVPVDH